MTVFLLIGWRYFTTIAIIWAPHRRNCCATQPHSLLSDSAWWTFFSDGSVLWGWPGQEKSDRTIKCICSELTGYYIVSFWRSKWPGSEIQYALYGNMRYVHALQLLVSSLQAFITLLLEIDKIIVLLVYKGLQANKHTTVILYFNHKKQLISVA